MPSDMDDPAAIHYAAASQFVAALGAAMPDLDNRFLTLRNYVQVPAGAT